MPVTDAVSCSAYISLTLCIGEYQIEVTYFDQPLTGSPFTAKAWDVNKVNVSNIVSGRVGLQSCFNSKLLSSDQYQRSV